MRRLTIVFVHLPTTIAFASKKSVASKYADNRLVISQHIISYLQIASPEPQLERWQAR
jgi:hypothetical protein